MPDEPVVCITTRIQNGKLEMRYCSEYVLQLKITRFIALPVQTCFFLLSPYKHHVAYFVYERTLRCLRGVNRQSVAKKHFKTVSHRLSPETPGFVFGVSGALAQRLRV